MMNFFTSLKSKPLFCHSLDRDGLEIWPGFSTRIDDYDGGRLLLLDVAHTVLRQATVLDQMRNEWRNNQRTIEEELIGTSVLTRYNNRHYRVDDVDFRKCPMDTFQKDGTQITYAQYLKQTYGTQDVDPNQPLLVHKLRVRFLRPC